MCSKFAASSLTIAAALAVSSSSLRATPVYGIEQAVALAQERNPEILIAHKKVMGARGGFIEARSGYLPSLSSSGLYDKRQTESQTNLRQEDYNAIIKLEQNLYTGGAVSSQVAIAQTDLKNSYLRLAELFGTDLAPGAQAPPFEISGQLQYRPNHPDLNDCLARADANRGIIKARAKDIEIEDRQYVLDRSATLPHVRAFSGYEVYSERDPDVGPEFNYGGVVGINATWNIFDGHATKGRMQATRARRDAAVQALAAARRSVASEVRSAFFDLQQADRVLESETKSLQTSDEALDMARGNFAAGLGTQLDVLQAAADVTRTRTTRLSAIYLHNVALARLARSCASSAEALNFGSDFKDVKSETSNAAHAADVAKPPQKMTQR